MNSDGEIVAGLENPDASPNPATVKLDASNFRNGREPAARGRASTRSALISAPAVLGNWEFRSQPISLFCIATDQSILGRTEPAAVPSRPDYLANVRQDRDPLSSEGRYWRFSKSSEISLIFALRPMLAISGGLRFAPIGGPAAGPVRGSFKLMEVGHFSPIGYAPLGLK